MARDKILRLRRKGYAASTGKSEPMTGNTTRELLGLAGYDVPLTITIGWDMDQRKRAADWAYAIYMEASGVVVKIPPKPDFIEPFKFEGVKR